jgi:hypothetical protein
MATQYQTMFEAPPSHEATQYSNPYTNPEFEDEWETSNENQEAHYSTSYSNPEFEDEWETSNENQEAHYSNPYSNPEFEDEWEISNEASHYSNAYSNPELESEWETSHEATHYSNPYSNPEFENEWETSHEATHYSNFYSNPEDEGEYFFKKAFRSIGRGLKAVVKTAAPFAKRFAPILAGKLATMIPGIGVIAGPLAAKLTSQLLKEGEMEAMQMEAEFFGTNEAEAEVANNETAHEAALTEFLAAQAAEASTEAEAEAAIAATLPITISIMGGRRALRPVMPVMAQATGRMTKLLRQEGPAGQQLLRTVPTIQRQAIATLKAAARSGQPINSATAVKALASATKRVLGNPQRVQRAIVRNAVLRQRTAPPSPRRNSVNRATSNCPVCARRAASMR